MYTVQITNLESYAEPAFVRRMFTEPLDDKIVEIECDGGYYSSAWITFKDLVSAKAAVEMYDGERSDLLSTFLREDGERQKKKTRTVQVVSLPDPHTRRAIDNLIEGYIGDQIKYLKAVATHWEESATALVQWHDVVDARGFVKELNGMYYKNATIYAYCVDDDEIIQHLPASKGDKHVGFWVGNLKAGISEEDLIKLFTPFTVQSVSIPSPSKNNQPAIAFVWMAQVDAAAFNALHTKGFKHKGKWIKVKLMKGKNNVITAVAPGTASASGTMDDLADKTASLKVQDSNQGSKKATHKKPPSNGFTDVRISNLSYSAKKPDLRDLFQDFETTKIVVKEGYGFVGFRSLQDAQAACSRLSGKKVLGRTVSVKLAGPPPSRS